MYSLGPYSCVLVGCRGSGWSILCFILGVVL
nr:MAG TPA: hypothetical protein [Caudoviricetes sp.]